MSDEMEIWEDDGGAIGSSTSDNASLLGASAAHVEEALAMPLPSNEQVVTTVEQAVA